MKLKYLKQSDRSEAWAFLKAEASGEQPTHRERGVQPVCRRTLQQDEDVELPRLEHVRASCGSCTFLSCGPWRLKREEKRGGATGARGPMASQRRGARGVRGKRVVDDARRARVRRQIFKTKAEPQRIVATGPLCRVQHPVPHSSRLQGIHRGGKGTCDRARLKSRLPSLAALRPPVGGPSGPAWIPA